MPDFVGELAASIAPYLSLVPSGGKAVKNTVQAALDEYKWVEARGHRQAFGRGAPTVSAVVTPLQGFATAVAVLSLQLFALGRDLHEMKKANRILKHPTQVKLSREIFDVCPLLGCYFIACSNTSDIINFLVEDIGAPGWQFDVEVMVKQHVQPMLQVARDQIASSRLEVDGLQMSKGAVSDLSKGPLGVSNIKSRLKKKVVSRIKQAVPFVEGEDYVAFAKKQGHEAVSRDVRKSRIQGLGSGRR